MNEILQLFPPLVRKVLQKQIENRWHDLQEIRIRLYHPIELVFDERIQWIHEVKPTLKDRVFILNQLSEFSLYRLEDELREGYITIKGGHRVGLAGEVNTKSGRVKAIKHITFLNIRIAKEQIGSAMSIIPYLYEKGYHNTLLIGPPQSGKTTILRDLARLIGSGWQTKIPRKVAIIDERSEIAAANRGIPQHNIGLRTDVMDACPKAEGMMMMIRSMSPEIIIVDEIGSKEDVAALFEAIHAGVTVISTVHGRSISEIKTRPSLKQLFDEKVFQRFVLLQRGRIPGKIDGIYDQEERRLLPMRMA